jgi:F0F1-type ATP synthase membrane subunit b/b'
MVTLNFTIVVQLVLFLLFLWGLRQFVIHPMLQQMDDRQHYIGQQESRAKVDVDLAAAQEARYAQAVKDMHQDAEQRFRDARHAALHEQAEILARQREQADRAATIARLDAQQRAQDERASFRQVVPELANAIAARVGIRKASS